MTDVNSLSAEIDEVRRSGALGRSELILRLFDYLAERSLNHRSPKEAEVGADVFGRHPNFDTTRDAVVRVYVHKLRRKLDAHYEGPRRASAVRINIPRGEYRLMLEPLSMPAEPSIEPMKPTAIRRSIWIVAAVVLAICVGAATWIVSRADLPPSMRQGLALRSTSVWGPLLSDRMPTLVVVGDYYIFGESDDGLSVARLVREYTVNSAGDLNAFLAQHPQLSARYVDLDLRYLPIGSAYALSSLAPVLTGEPNGPAPRVILASELSPDMIRRNNIVYIGYFSGLGALKDTVFAGSRFSVGDTYDQILDKRSNRKFSSGGGGPDATGAMYRDYGYFSSFSGPAGGRVVIIAGTRDVGLMQTAEAATSTDALQAATRGSTDFEALYDVQGMNRQNVAGKLIIASPIDSSVKWTGTGARAPFPSG
ncbi:MAG TPA: hypothetical protein VMU59_04140 [Caulobacteraceae bacterium]|nr:hypothetical protein [Caulobacteraceae bacterium]